MNTSENQSTIFQKGEKASPDYFTGTAWVKILVNEPVFNCQIANVIFEQGARNYWHRHPGGQILLVTEGTGYYQEKDGPIQLLRKGDVVKILPDIIHWHGATPSSELSHIAINSNTQKGIVEWLQKVTDEEFSRFHFSK
jgi:quercetin dioxygenase-like cupin family protein